jgi:ankyrin repeat protein
MASYYRNVDVLCLCEELGADLDVVNPNGITALHIASREGFDDIVRVSV